MRSRSSLLILAGAILVAWLLISSIHFIQPTQASQESGEPQQNQQSGGGGGGSTSIGSVTNPIFQLPKITLPPIKFPGFNFTLPNFSSSAGNGSLGGLGNGFGLGNGSGSGPGSGGRSGSGNGDGSGIGSGFGNGGNPGPGFTSPTSSSGQSQDSGPAQTQITETTQNAHLEFSLPYDLLIVIIILIVIFAGAIAFVSRRGWTGLSRKKSSNISSEQQGVQLLPPACDTIVSPVMTELTYGEMIAPFKGWGDQEGLIRPEINPELPLIWGLDEPLMVEVPEEAAVSMDGRALQKQSPTSYSIRFSHVCNELDGTLKGASESKYIRAVRYD
jgi:hypothetical protein